MKRTQIIGIPLAATIALLTGGLAISYGGENKQETVSPSPSVTMEEAMKTATDRFPGQVLEAELETEDGKSVYEVEVAGANGERREVEVDAQTGKILKSGVEDEENEKGSETEDR